MEESSDPETDGVISQPQWQHGQQRLDEITTIGKSQHHQFSLICPITSA